MDSPAVKSALRTLAIFEYFAGHRRPARLSEVASALGYPVSSTEALLKTIAAEGYIDHDVARHTYVPSPRLTRLAAWIDPGGFEHQIAREAMYRLRAAAGHPAVLAAPDGLHLHYVASAPVRRGDRLRIAAGTRRVLVQTGTGWLFLARGDRGEATAVYRATVAAGLLDAEAFGEREFEARLEQYQDLAVSVLWASDLAVPTGHWNGGMISALVATPPGHRPLALGVYGEVGTLEADRGRIIAALQQEVARVAEEAAGYAPAR